ncbi:MAG: L-2-amino-thiazoline-4-carboxylic acid hydrolase [Actinomycetota bacterium]
MTSDDRPHELTAYERMRIQMEYTVPLLRDLQSILGEKAVLDALAERLRRRVRAAEIRAEPRRVGETRVAIGFDHFAAGGALDYETLADAPDAVDIDVNRCSYATMMQELDAADLGDILICGEDLVTVARAGTRLTRSETHMLGGTRCDFRFRSGS